MANTYIIECTVRKFQIKFFRCNECARSQASSIENLHPISHRFSEIYCRLVKIIRNLISIIFRLIKRSALSVKPIRSSGFIADHYWNWEFCNLTHGLKIFEQPLLSVPQQCILLSYYGDIKSDWDSNWWGNYHNCSSYDEKRFQIHSMWFAQEDSVNKENVLIRSFRRTFYAPTIFSTRRENSTQTTQKRTQEKICSKAAQIDFHSKLVHCCRI